MAIHFGTFYRGVTVRLYVECRNYLTNALADPSTTQTVTLQDSEGTSILAAQALTKDATGKYYYEYTTTSSSPCGRWVGYFTMTSGTTVSNAKFSFDVETL